MGTKRYEAVIVGSGPNGLAAAITLCRNGKSVLVIEGAEDPGGGLRTQELTRPGFLHDVCAAVHPLAMASPFFRHLDLSKFGLQWIHSTFPLAHPLDDEPAVIMDRSLEETAKGLGADRESYIRMFKGPASNWEKIVHDLLRPLGIPKYPFLMAGMGPLLVRSAVALAHSRFKGNRARALFAGNAAHSISPLDRLSTGAFGVMLGMLGHGVGWPVARGGSKSIARAMILCLESNGGQLITGRKVRSIEDIPPTRTVFFDLTPKGLSEIEGLDFPAHYRDRLAEHKYGPGVFKIDWALDGPIPWTDPACMGAGTLHLGGSLEEIVESESKILGSESSDKPYVLLNQPSLFDETRTSRGFHTAWAYCHTPNGSKKDMTKAIEDQVERFAPGFRNRVLDRHVMFPKDMEEHNPNYVGGDIAGGPQGLLDLFVMPLGRRKAYETPLKGIYICSSSMPPGAGVHGMCGHLAAKVALQNRDL